MTLQACVVTPRIYTYGALLVAGILNSLNIHTVYSKLESNGIPSTAEIICLSLHSTTDILECRESLSEICRRKKALVIVGGSAAFAPEIVFKHMPNADVIVLGEAENALPEIINSYREGSSFGDIEGVAVQHKGNVIRARKSKPADMNRPLPLIPSDLHLQDIRGANIYIETHRGCTGDCTFCLVPTMFGHKIRSRPLDEILREVRVFKQKGADKIAISGGSVSLYGSDGNSVNEAEFTNLLKNISKIVGKGNLTSSDLRIDLITSKVLEAVKEYTSGYVSFGLESGSSKLLSAMRKGFNPDDIREGVALTKKMGLKIIGSFIAGYPGETVDDFKATCEIIKDLDLFDYAINIAEPIPGTLLWELMDSPRAHDNPLYRRADEAIDGVRNLSVAEYRALYLKTLAYKVIYNKECPSSILAKFLAETRREHARIVNSLNACKSQSLEICRKGTSV